MKKIFIFLCPLLLCACVSGTPRWQWNGSAWVDPQEAKAFASECQAYLNRSGANPTAADLFFKNGMTWPDLILSMQEMIQTAAEGHAKLKNPTKNNMPLNALLYNEADVRTAQVGSFLGKYESYQTDPCYTALKEQNEQLALTRDEIGSYSYNYERKKFKQKTGYTFSDEGSVLDFVSSTFGRGTPSKGVLYGVNNVRVLQSVPGGVLFVMDTSGTYMVDSGVGFLATTKKYADGSFIHGIYAAYTGLKRYNTVLGANKQVYAFKVVNTNTFAKQLSGFYFYPEVKEISADELMPKLIQEI